MDGLSYVGNLNDMSLENELLDNLLCLVVSFKEEKIAS